jgi:hypothetical protein
MKIFCVTLVIACLAMVFPFIAAPIDDPSLVLYLPFNEGSGNIANDFSGKGNDGVLKNGTTWVDGKMGKALLFNGVDNYVEVAKYIPIDDRPFTVEAWVYRAKEQKVNSFDMIITQTDDFATDKGFHFAVRSDAENGILAFAFFANDLGSNATIEKEQWYHLVGVYTGKKQQVFINGKLDNERDATPYKGTKGSILIGIRQEGIHAPGQFDGIIDEVAIYQKALDEAEIKQDMNSEFIKAAVYPSGKLATAWGDIKIE